MFFAIDAVRVVTTRARSNDTDIVSPSLGGATTNVLSVVRDVGDVSSGGSIARVDLQIRPIEVNHSALFSFG